MIRNKIANRDSVPIEVDNGYYNPFSTFTDEEKIDNIHRVLIGGPWEEETEHQFNLLRLCGLKPNMKILDVGCGSLRVGRKLIEYLEPFNYYGIDINLALVDAGLNYEIPRLNLQDKIGDQNFIITDDFSFNDFDVLFDFGLAHSVFTHLHHDKLREFLCKAYSQFSDSGKILMTFIIVPEEETIDTTYVKKEMAEPYKYHISDIQRVCEETSWNCEKMLDTHYGHTYMMFTKNNT